MLTKDEQALYNVLTLYADEDGEISEEVSFETLARIAGIGKRTCSDSARRLLNHLEEKGYIRTKIQCGTKFKEIRILK